MQELIMKFQPGSASRRPFGPPTLTVMCPATGGKRYAIVHGTKSMKSAFGRRICWERKSFIRQKFDSIICGACQ